jgi:hypothetical protein
MPKSKLCKLRQVNYATLVLREHTQTHTHTHTLRKLREVLLENY